MRVFRGGTPRHRQRLGAHHRQLRRSASRPSGDAGLVAFGSPASWLAFLLTFEPHPRDYFAGLAGRADAAPRRIATLRDKLSELQRCGIDQTVVLRFDAALAGQSPDSFIDNVLMAGLGARYVLVGDDFRFGAKRAGDYASSMPARRARLQFRGAAGGWGWG